MVPRRPLSGVPPVRVSMPQSRLALTGALVAPAAAAAVANRPGAGPSTPAAVAGLAAALCAAGFLSLELRHRDGVERLELFGPVLLVAVFALPSRLAVLVAALTAALLEGLRRVPPPRAAFTVARWSCAAAAGSLTFAALREGLTLAPRNLLALAAAMLAASATAGLPLWLGKIGGEAAGSPGVGNGQGPGGSEARGRAEPDGLEPPRPRGARCAREGRRVGAGRPRGAGCSRLGLGWPRQT